VTVEDRVDRGAGAQLDGDALGVQQRELHHAPVTVLPLPQVRVSVQQQVRHSLPDQRALRRRRRR